MRYTDDHAEKLQAAVDLIQNVFLAVVPVTNVEEQCAMDELERATQEILSARRRLEHGRQVETDGSEASGR